MPKKIPQIDIILDIISRFPNGASVEEILIGLSPAPSRRTLQYRLSSLVKNGTLLAEGKTKGRRFKLPEKKQQHQLEEKNYIPPVRWALTRSIAFDLFPWELLDLCISP